jgi:hypothetical protein
MNNSLPIPESQDVRIVCPECKTKQNGIIRMHQYGNTEVPYIKCCIQSCEFIIVSDDLEEVTRQVVKFPSDLRGVAFPILSQTKSST